MKLRHKFVVFVSAVIKNKDKFLILKRSQKLSHHPGMWSIVSISVKSGETPEAAVRRGVYEEAGIVIQPIRIFQTYNFFYENDPDQEAVGFVFETNYISGEIRLDEQKNSDYEWIKAPNIYNYEFTGTVKENLLEIANLANINPNNYLRDKELTRTKLINNLNPREKELLNIFLDNFGKQLDIQTISEKFGNKVKGEDPSYTLIYKTISTLRNKVESKGVLILHGRAGYELIKKC